MLLRYFLFLIDLKLVMNIKWIFFVIFKSMILSPSLIPSVCLGPIYPNNNLPWSVAQSKQVVFHQSAQSGINNAGWVEVRRDKGEIGWVVVLRSFNINPQVPHFRSSEQISSHTVYLSSYRGHYSTSSCYLKTVPKQNVTCNLT